MPAPAKPEDIQLNQILTAGLLLSLWFQGSLLGNFLSDLKLRMFYAQKYVTIFKKEFFLKDIYLALK
jgi:hypothetical protein